MVISRRQQLLALSSLSLAPLWAACSPHSSPVTPSIGATPLAHDSKTQAAHHVIYSYPGTVFPQELHDRISDEALGGIIFFAENIGNLSTFKDTLYSITQTISHTPHQRPILLMTDEEGGFVNRIHDMSMSQKNIGNSSNPSHAAYKQAQHQAQLFRRYHLNTNLAPVLGVSRKKQDFLDTYERSFSFSPTLTAEAGAAYIREFQRHQLIATAKHFPGLGGAPQAANTDNQPVTINLSLHDLSTIDFLPFRQAISAGVKAIMPSWAQYPALDPRHCAGMSTKIITSILRHQLGFTGVTITDALEAGALSTYGTTAQRAVMAKLAGNDFLCCSQRSIAQGDDAVHGLERAIHNGTIPMHLWQQSSERINRIISDLRKS